MAADDLQQGFCGFAVRKIFYFQFTITMEFQGKVVATWSEDEVSDWLRSLGLDSVIAEFKEHGGEDVDRIVRCLVFYTNTIELG